MNLKDYAFIAGSVFLAIMVLHLSRIFLGWRMEINGVDIPLQWSLFAAGISGGLAVFGLGLSKSKK